MNRFNARKRGEGLMAPLGAAPMQMPMPMAPTGPAPMPMAPTGLAPTQIAPTGLAPMPMAPTGVQPTAIAPTGMAPMPMAPVGAFPAFPPGAPVVVAPVRRVVHPTRVIERHTVTRVPVVNVFPTHIRNVHHRVLESYCEYPCTQSHHCCDHVVDHCNVPPGVPGV